MRLFLASAESWGTRGHSVGARRETSYTTAIQSHEPAVFFRIAHARKGGGENTYFSPPPFRACAIRKNTAGSRD